MFCLIGEYNLYLPDVNTIDYQVSRIILHVNYTGLTNKRKATKNADIALIRSKNPIVLGDYAWPICYFDSEEEEKEGLLELKRQSKAIKKGIDKDLNYSNDFVEHQITDEELLEDNYFSILDESNCESYNQLDFQILTNNLNNNHQQNHLDIIATKNLNRTKFDRFNDKSLDNNSSNLKLNLPIQSSSSSIKYPLVSNLLANNNLLKEYPTNPILSNNLKNLISEDHSLSKINITKLTSLSNLAIVVGWGKKHEKEDQYSSYLQKSTLCLIPNKVCEHWYKSAGRLMNIHNEMLCAGWRNGGRDACHGDSGKFKITI